MAAAGVAAFDFDGTLTRADTFVGFLRRVAGPAAVATAFARVSPVLTTARSDPAWRDAVKARLVALLLRGRPLAEVEAEAERYGALCAAQVTPAMRQLIGRHRDSGHRVLIVSASLELYLRPAAPLIGAHDVLATRLEVDADGRLTGRLDGGNCRGPEKASRLAAWMDAEGVDPETVPMWAYGDSSGDDHLLALARVATRVRRGRPLTEVDL